MYLRSAPQRVRDVPSSSASLSKHGPPVRRRRLGPDDSAGNVTEVSAVLEYRSGPVVVFLETRVNDDLLASGTRQSVCGQLVGGACCKGGGEEGCECENFGDHLEKCVQRRVMKRVVAWEGSLPWDETGVGMRKYGAIRVPFIRKCHTLALAKLNDQSY